MLSKNRRLDTNEFNSVYKNGKNVNLSVGYIKIVEFDGETKISCTASKKKVKNSVHRTKIRRRGYAAVKKVLDNLPSGYHVIWFLPAEALDVEFLELEKSVEEMICSLNSV